MTVYTVLPQDDLNLEVTVTDPALDPSLQDDSDLDVTIQESDNPVVLNITPAAVDITSAVESVNSKVGVVVLDTDDVSEGSNNLYYTDARTDARVDLQTGANLDLSFSDTDDLAEGPNNLYYTTARDSAQFDTDLATKDTGDLAEGSNLYYTDARAQSVVTSNTEGFIKADSTDTLTNKSGSNSQWTNDEAYLKAAALTPYYTKTQTDALPVSTFTNDAGYITSETDNQTLSFADPDLSISNGNSVDLTSLKTTALAFSAITSTPTTVAGYGITDAFSGDYDDLTNKPTIPTNNNQLSNGAAYITASSTDTLTNKSGNISMFTNDAGYITSETDSQTLSFSSPNLTISNGNTVDLSDLNVNGGTY